MRCKPGDLAIVLAPTSGHRCDMTGELVQVMSPFRFNFNAPDGTVIRFTAYRATDDLSSLWIIKRMAPLSTGVSSLTGEMKQLQFDTMWDHRLRPLRDPGEDAQDESKAWLPPVPQPEKEIA